MAIGGNIRGIIIEINVAGPPVLNRDRLKEPNTPMTTAINVLKTDTIMVLTYDITALGYVPAIYPIRPPKRTK
jgi:hypothetical protein